MDQMFAASSRTSHSEVRAICSNEEDLAEKVDGERRRENLINRTLVKQFEHLKHSFTFSMALNCSCKYSSWSFLSFLYDMACWFAVLLINNYLS